jgi:hypothetical protein
VKRPLPLRDRFMAGLGLFKQKSVRALAPRGLLRSAYDLLCLIYAKWPRASWNGPGQFRPTLDLRLASSTPQRIHAAQCTAYCGALKVRASCYSGSGLAWPICCVAKARFLRFSSSFGAHQLQTNMMRLSLSRLATTTTATATATAPSLLLQISD